MNNEIPSHWVVISELFFVVGITTLIVAVVLLYKVYQIVLELKPKVDSLTTKVESMVVKVESVADRVDGVAESMKLSIDGVSTSAKSVMGVLDYVTRGATNKLDTITPILAGGLAVFKIFKTYQAMRATTKALPKKTKR